MRYFRAIAWALSRSWSQMPTNSINGRSFSASKWRSLTYPAPTIPTRVMCSGPETRRAMDGVFVNRVEAIADDRPIVPARRELAPSLFQSVPQLGVATQAGYRLHGIFGGIRDEDFLSRFGF